MSEESLREIIAVAKKSKWSQIKRVIKSIISKTLKKDAGYRLIALDALVNGKKRQNYNQVINTKEKVKELDKIRNFNHLSLYQATPTANNHISLSQTNGTIIVLTKYLGPNLDDYQIFDFSVNLDALDEPFFTMGTGKKLNSSEFLKIINKKIRPQSIKQKKIPKKKAKDVMDPEIQNIEVFIFEKLTEKNAIWNGSETKNFQNWKAKIRNKYRLETGKITHYKGKSTLKFTQYLKSLIKNSDTTKKKPQKIIEKKSVKLKIDRKEISEQYIFEKNTGKNAIWHGTETKNFVRWKDKLHKKYKKDTGKNPYYKQKLTQNYSSYLLNAFKGK